MIARGATFAANYCYRTGGATSDAVKDHDSKQRKFAVDYQSPSHFNRDYARLFGTPPHRDIEQLQSSGNSLTSV